jgi:UDP-N-acetylmuramate dehydrogenase
VHVGEELKGRFGAVLSDEEPLDRHTTMGVGGRARWFFMPRDVAETADLLAALGRMRVPTFILGGGSNLIVKDRGFEGAVVNLSALSSLKVSGDRIRAEAGVPLSKVAKRAMEAGLSGMEGLVGIPGTIGGAVFMNAGGRRGEIGDVVESIATLDRRGRVSRLTRDQVGFRYRGTNLGDLVVIEATLRLRPAEKRGICEEMAAYLKWKHETQPMGQRSAGCIFKNPAPGRAAAWLIDTAGLKGEHVGAAEVSGRHANFIVNNGGASSQDIFSLIARVRREVLLRHETSLGLEVKVLGEQGLELA